MGDEKKNQGEPSNTRPEGTGDPPPQEDAPTTPAASKASQQSARGNGNDGPTPTSLRPQLPVVAALLVELMRRENPTTTADQIKDFIEKLKEDEGAKPATVNEFATAFEKALNAIADRQRSQSATAQAERYQKNAQEATIVRRQIIAILILSVMATVSIVYGTVLVLPHQESERFGTVLIWLGGTLCFAVLLACYSLFNQNSGSK